MSSIPSYPSLVHLPILCTEGTVPLLRLLAVWLWPSPGFPGVVLLGSHILHPPVAARAQQGLETITAEVQSASSEHWEG